MMIDVAVRGAVEIKLLRSWCKVVVMYEVVVSYVNEKNNRQLFYY